MASDDEEDSGPSNFYADNLALVNTFTREPLNFPYLFPQDRVDYYRYLLIPHKLPPSIAPRCYQICRHIVRHWRPFEESLHSYTSAIIRLDTTLEIHGDNILASPLSIVSALIAAAATNLRQFAPLIFFCHEKLPHVTNRRATPVEVVTSLISQLMHFIPNHPRNISLRPLTEGQQTPYPNVKHSLFHALAFLKLLLLALPKYDTVHIILDRVSSLRAPHNEIHGFLLDLVKLVEATREHVKVKLVLTGTTYYPEDLGQDYVDCEWKVFEPEDYSHRDAEMIPVDGFRTTIEGLIMGHGEEGGPQRSQLS